MISNLSKAYLKRAKRLNAQNVILLIFLRMEKIETERKDLYAKIAEKIDPSYIVVGKNKSRCFK